MVIISFRSVLDLASSTSSSSACSDGLSIRVDELVVVLVSVDPLS